MPDARLQPKAIASTLFAIDPDRDERASQLCAETLLTLDALNFIPTAKLDRSPKEARFALRSLVFGVNFLHDRNDPIIGNEAMAVSEYGRKLATGEDFQGSENLGLAKTALANLIDPTTEQGQEGQHLLMPFHRSLLWYDARANAGKYHVRKVRMRGSGITLARMLAAPPESAGEQVREWGHRAVAGIRDALTVDSPLAVAAQQLETVIPRAILDRPPLEDDERRAWDLGAEDRVASLAGSISLHAEGIMEQGEASPPARIWQLRSVLALDLAVDCLRRAWTTIGTAPSGQAILLASAGPSRSEDRVRLRSEVGYGEARTSLNWATIKTLEARMREIHEAGGIDWGVEVDSRTRRSLASPVIQQYRPGEEQDFARTAQLIFETASYGRSGEGFRVLLESIGMSAGGTRYRYLSASPDLLATMVGALSRDMPMTSQEFFLRIAQEWGLVISPEGAQGTVYATDLEGSELATNARRFERQMIDAGLASGLSDRTVLVGERAARRRS